MGRGKGPGGKTCAEAIRDAIGLLGNGVSAKDIFDEVSKKNVWKDQTIWRHIMSCTVNLTAGYWEWKGLHPNKKFLFLREDGRYELYEPERHGRYVDGLRIGFPL